MHLTIKQLAWIAAFLAIWTIPRAELAAAKKKPKVLLVSMDGFRHDYLTHVDTPNFDKMIREGVTMPWINNTFTTLTFPCHFTMVTGLYEETHGIVGNNMYDPEMKRNSFWMGTTDEDWWTGHETIWTSAQKSGLKSGVYFWPGSSSIIQRSLPEASYSYNGSVPFEDRVDKVVDWMSNDDFDLGLLYFNEPDHAGHTNGPLGTQTLEQVVRMDGILGRLMSKLEAAGIADDVNVIVTSDHGMADVDTDTRIIDLSDYVNESLVLDVVMQGPAVQIRPQPGKAQELVDALKDVEHMTAMLKEDIPERFHYANHRRVQPVFLLADEGWSISENVTDRNRRVPRFLGNHGFDNALPSMKPIFVAKGPAFKTNAKVESIKTVDIYPLICHLLDIKPAPNNGSLARAATLLNYDPNLSARAEISGGLVMVLLVLSKTIYFFIV